MALQPIDYSSLGVQKWFVIPKMTRGWRVEGGRDYKKTTRLIVKRERRAAARKLQTALLLISQWQVSAFPSAEGLFLQMTLGWRLARKSHVSASKGSGVQQENDRQHFFGSRNDNPQVSYLRAFFQLFVKQYKFDFPSIYHTSNLSFFLHRQNFWRIKFTPKSANFSR